jgi:dTDP-4-dehydrorhamnose reductase
MARYLVTGANGMLGSALCPILIKKGYEVVLTDINTSEMGFLDVCDFQDVISFFKRVKPGIVVHLAAATDMDMCQKNVQFTYLVNTKGTENVASACKEVGAEMVYISTGAVFNGKKDSPYIESDKTDPVNIYGRTKLAGEEFVRRTLRKYYIFRAGWIVGGFEKDKKFVANIIKQLETNKELKVVNDRFGSPTCVEDFSKNILKVLEAKLYGLYHVVNRGGCSRYDMALKIIEFLGRKDIKVIPIRNSDYPSITPRARTEVMINQRLKELGMDYMPFWKEALSAYLKKLQSRRLLKA